jgi:hypothetical protein
VVNLNEYQFNKYIKKIRKKRKYDPRQDLESDSWLWKRVLKTAERINKEAYTALYNARTVGARLKRKEDGLQLNPPKFKNDDHLISTKKDWEKYRKKYFYPLKKDIIKIFKIVDKYLEQKTIKNAI